jgi:alpha-D-xyloside xylohydrolase
MSSYQLELEKILKVVVTNKTKNSVIFEAYTLQGSIFNIEIGFHWEDTIRFRLFREDVKNTNPINLDLDRKINVEVLEDEEYVRIVSNQLICEILLQPFEFRVKDKGGNIIWGQQRNDINVRGNSNVPFLGVNLSGGNIKRIVDSFILWPEDRIYGFGEKFFAHDKRGYTIVSWNMDAYGVETERSYKNIPFFLCNRGYGVLFNSMSKMEHSVGDPAWSRASYILTVEDQKLDYFFIYGPSFKHIIKRYCELTGFAPVPPMWAFGLWMSRCYFHNREVAEEVACKLRELGIPSDVIVFDSYWMKDGHLCNLKWDKKRFPNARNMIASIKALGFKVCVWEAPFVPLNTKMMDEGEEGGYLLVNSDGETYLIETGLVMASHNIEGFKGQETVGSFDELSPAPKAALVDFTNPNAVKWYQEKHDALLEMGIDVFKTDFGEQVPEDSISPYSGLTGMELHNLYTVLYNKAVFDVTKKHCNEGLVWARSASVGSQKYPVHWGGDPQTSYSSMAGSLRGGLSLGLSGIPFWGSDIGGFFGDKPNKKLYLRWSEFGLFSGIARCHGTTPREPWEYGEEAINIFRKFANLRYRLIPYLYSCAKESSKNGLPLMRPLFLEFQDDPVSHFIDTQYLLGEWLMVAPIFSEKDERLIYLPDGRWIDYWTHSLTIGPKYIHYDTPLDILPIFLREGAIIPFGPEMQFVGEKPIDPITLLIFPASNSQFEYYDGEEKILITCNSTSEKIDLVISESKKSFAINIVGINVTKIIKYNKDMLPFRVNSDQVDNEWKFDKEKGLIFKITSTPCRLLIYIK